MLVTERNIAKAEQYLNENDSRKVEIEDIEETQRTATSGTARLSNRSLLRRFTSTLANLGQLRHLLRSIHVTVGARENPPPAPPSLLASSMRTCKHVISFLLRQRQLQNGAFLKDKPAPLPLVALV